MPRNGFTPIERLIVVACSIGILTACDGTGPSEDTILASMKSDLLALVPLQEAYFLENNDYTASITSGPQINGGPSGYGSLSFVPSQGNVLVLTYVGWPNWRASVTNPALAYNPKNCGIFVGSTSNAPNAAVTEAGVPACW